MEGGVDLLLPETGFDTLNLKAALFAVRRYFDEHRTGVPVMASFTITDASGRTLSGQTAEAVAISLSHADLLSVGINCALGARARCGPISRSWRASPPASSAVTRTPVCPTSSAATTRHRRRWRRRSASSPARAG